MARTTLMESQLRASRGNPRVERAIGRWRARFRKLKLHFAGQIGRRIARDHPLVQAKGEGKLRVPEPDPRPYIPRRPTIRCDNFCNYGFTAGSAECSGMQTGIGDAADDRVNAWTARRVEDSEAPEKELQPRQELGEMPE